MLVSTWKSSEEIQLALGEARCLAVLSCNICANLNGTGGSRGLRQITRLLRQWDKTVVLAKTVNACCSEEIMRQVVRLYINPVRDRCDALVMLSCAGGVKCAFLCDPGLPVVAALDSPGSGVVATSMTPMEVGVCQTCDHCVLTYTGGICPLSACPAKKKYGPCKKAPEAAGPCAVNPEQDCVWTVIEKRADMETLSALAELHQQKGYERLPSVAAPSSPTAIRRFSGWFMARIPGIHRLVDMIR
jgi:hypothetical protein